MAFEPYHGIFAESEEAYKKDYDLLMLRLSFLEKTCGFRTSQAIFLIED